MLNVTGATRVLVATTPVDLRGSFNRLYSLVVEQLKGDPLSGHLFVFTNGRRNRVKVLYWDGSGLWVCAKRLEQGRFTWPVSENGQIDLRGEEFSASIHGLEVRSKKNWYRRSIRPSALGKKNWLFVGHPEAGERSAVIYTLLGSCRRHGINPFDYLKDLFTRLPAAKITHIQEFTPAAWAKAKTKEQVVAQAA